MTIVNLKGKEYIISDTILRNGDEVKISYNPDTLGSEWLEVTITSTRSLPPPYDGWIYEFKVKNEKTNN